jgi:exonuclease III
VEIDQKEITIINLYAPNLSAPNFIKHTLKALKAHIDSNTVVVGDFNTHSSTTDRSSKKKINKKIVELNHTKDQMVVSTEYFIQHLHNMYSSQQPKELSAKLIIP